ncbi:T9SS type A sorting domain-containing protein [candidate division KSB1 bacterium]|nr:T9SS type A sorting domain-containing protein [candidate division KSB1 bacterium]
MPLAAPAQWRSDPAAHIFYEWPAGVNLDFCTDGLGGAFFTFAIGPGDYYVGHINADGYQTMSTFGLYEHLQEFEPFPHWNWSVKLVPSLPGTVIAIGDRENGDFTYDGIAVVKYDTVGVAGFGRIMVTDTTLHFDGAERVSDQQGGVHLTGRSGDLQDYFYNHLSNSGIWRYNWPGYHISHRGGGHPVQDGYGSAIVEWMGPSEWPDPPGGAIWQHMDVGGNALWAPEGRRVRQVGYYSGIAFLLEPGRLFSLADSLYGDINGQRGYRLFLNDTSGADLWPEYGVRLGQDDSSQIGGEQFVPDGQGGFLFNRIIVPYEAYQVERYNRDAQLIAVSAGSLYDWIHLGDGIGGGYGHSYETSGGGTSIVIRRYTPELELAWSEPTTALVSDSPLSMPRYLVTADHRLIGVASFDLGFEFYNVNPDGSLGPRLAVGREAPALVESMQLVAYPNPFNSTISIALRRDRRDPVNIVIYDVLGRIITVSPLLTGNDLRWSWDARHEATGNYYVTFRSNIEPVIAPTTRRILLVR